MAFERVVGSIPASRASCVCEVPANRISRRTFSASSWAEVRGIAVPQYGQSVALSTPSHPTSCQLLATRRRVGRMLATLWAVEVGDVIDDRLSELGMSPSDLMRVSKLSDETIRRVRRGHSSK